MTLPKTLRAPFPWFGGKSRVSSVVWERFGDCPNYVEPFAGSLAVLLGRPSEPRIETVNDADCYLANFWRAVQHAPDEVAHWADWPVNEADLHARHLWLVNTAAERVERLKTEPDYHDAQIAGWWVWGICAWIGSGWCDRPDWLTRPDLTSEGRGIHSPSRQVRHLSAGGMGVHRKPSHQLPHLGNAGRGVSASGVTSVREWMLELADRLRRVRVCGGDWSRVCTPAVTFRHGVTGVFLDPPYSHEEREVGVYAQDQDVGAAVRAWAIENGTNPELRIALCGYEGEHDMPVEWSTFAWKAHGGYGGGRSTRADANSHRERIWFSPHCLGPHSAQLSLPLGEAA